MLITSGYNFEGYHISKYLGICSGECALGTGFLSSFGAGLADLLGTNSSLYGDKLSKAREYAINNLISKANILGANAIIAVDIDYTVFSADILGVTANGTAVIIEELPEYSNSSQMKVDIKNFNPDLPFVPNNILITSKDNKCYASLSIIDIHKNNVTAVACNITFSTILDDEYQLNNIAFYKFNKCDNDRSFFNNSENNRLSVAIPVAIPVEKIELLKSANVKVIKYYDSDKVVIPSENDTVWNQKIESNNDETYNVSLYTKLLLKIRSLQSAKEIYEYCMEFNNLNYGIISPELLEVVRSIALNERLYGNMYKECVKRIEQFIE